ncbi:DUF418 domain-containing protein [Magnetococcales bacterium HHB-1]
MITANLTPVASTQRLKSIDALRGIAILAILILNVQSVAWVSAAYSNPSLIPMDFLDQFLWGFGRIFVDLKAINLLAILFGVGIALQSDRNQRSKAHYKKIYFRRMFWLMLFGLLHGTLIWFGDFLFSYAISGFLIFWLRHERPSALFTTAFILLLPPLLVMYQSQLWIEPMPPWQLKLFSDYFWHPPQEEIIKEVIIYQGAWLQQMPERLSRFWFLSTTLFFSFNFWKSTAMMLIGMGFYRLGLFSSQPNLKILYGLLFSLGIGILLASYGLFLDSTHHWHVSFSLYQGRSLLYLSSIFMSLGYLGLFLLLIYKGWLRRSVKLLIPVGRLALSNYIIQSLILTTIFYGHGLGFFNQWNFSSLFILVIMIWSVQLIYSRWWLRKFRFGPLEWLWRSLSYQRVQSFA